MNTKHDGTVTVGVLLASVALTACSGSTDTPDESEPTRLAFAAPAKEQGRPEHIPGESVTAAPRLPEGKALAEIAAAEGSRTVPLGRIGEGPLSVLVNCQGRGTLEVTLQPMGMKFPLSCVKGEVSSTYNELRLKKPRAEATLKVTVPSTVRWSLTAGQ
ncbi:hypothetical protein GCM10018785_26310 [Streptomyces longispororuber]|uniref:Lipoprotein n=1 Tax=Streptomyces longispororuber TaxID=68230 RepID=A0A918ZK14_9ACTN|nr:hypothetical protein [Streptomyces longispororuber]GHE55651.1 hypothetical protein GCM10018785_26310 [Streptomyces longispororuber]